MSSLSESSSTSTTLAKEAFGLNRFLKSLCLGLGWVCGRLCWLLSCDCLLLLGQKRAMWPCLSHSKHRPSTLNFFFWSSDVALRTTSTSMGTDRSLGWVYEDRCEELDWYDGRLNPLLDLLGDCHVVGHFLSMLYLISWRWISACAAAIHCASVACLGMNVSLPRMASKSGLFNAFANMSLVAASSSPNSALVARRLNLATKASMSVPFMRNSCSSR